jgi:hypothetical protein
MQVQYRARLKSGFQILSNYTWSHAIDEVSSDITSGTLERGSADFDVRHNFSGALSYELPSVRLKSILRDWSVDAIVYAQSGRPVNVLSSSFFGPGGTLLSRRADLVLGVPLYIPDPTVAGGRRFNTAAFRTPPTTCIPNPPGPCIVAPARQGTLGRNVLRELPLYQVDLALARSFNLKETLKLKFKAEAFNLFNHPMFGNYRTNFAVPSTFGVPSQTLNARLGGLNSLYQLGGPRSIQFSLRLSF